MLPLLLHNFLPAAASTGNGRLQELGAGGGRLVHLWLFLFLWWWWLLDRSATLCTMFPLSIPGLSITVHQPPVHREEAALLYHLLGLPPLLDCFCSSLLCSSCPHASPAHFHSPHSDDSVCDHSDISYWSGNPFRNYSCPAVVSLREETKRFSHAAMMLISLSIFPSSFFSS